jgi:alpha/beta superfamily hydrolase
MVAAHDPRPKLVIVPERDQFNPPDPARAATADWVATRVVVVAGADHFFAGRTAQAADLVIEFVDSLLP